MFKTLNLTLPSNSFTHTTTIQSPSNSPPSLISPRGHPFSVSCIASIQDPSQICISGSKSLYDVLKVERTASSMEIKTAYRRLAKMYHPDTMMMYSSPVVEQQTSVIGSDGRGFIEIHNAYETLSNPTARAIYDLSLGLNSRRMMAMGDILSSSIDDNDSSSLRYGSSHRSGSTTGYYPTRRWETDQCW